MSILAEVASGGVSGLLQGIGKAARDIRAAITGEEVLSAEARAELLRQATEIEKAILQADVEVVKGQMEIDLVEASSVSFFKSGWRPAVGWVCVLGLFYSFVLKPLLPWLATLAGKSVPPMPTLDMGELMTLLGGLLGLGGFRTYERLKGKA